jgi:hypothetical protein
VIVILSSVACVVTRGLCVAGGGRPECSVLACWCLQKGVGGVQGYDRMAKSKNVDVWGLGSEQRTPSQPAFVEQLAQDRCRHQETYMAGNKQACFAPWGAAVAMPFTACHEPH